MKAHQVVLLSVLILVLACSRDPMTGPGGDDAYVLETTQTVGAAGATVTLEDLSLVVPPGAFDEDHTLKVYASSEDRPFAHKQVTRSFRIEGLPTGYDLPLRVSIKHEGSLSGESYVAVDTEVFAIIADSSAMLYELCAAADSSGFLVSELPPQEGNVSAARQGLHGSPVVPNGTLNMHGATGMRRSADTHFRILYPEGLVAEGAIEELRDILEDNYTKVVQEIGFTYEERWPRFPVEVIVDTWDPPVRAFGTCRPGEWCLYVHRDGLTETDKSQLRIDTGRFMLLFAMLKYRHASAFLNSTMDPTDAWFHHAVLVWSEDVFTDDPDYRVPSLFSGYGMAPFRGMAAGAGYSHQSHGRGMAGMIEYLFTSGLYSFADLVQTYEAINGVNNGEGTERNPTWSLLNNVNALVAEWWPLFFKSYVRGETYGVGKDVFTSSANLAGSWTIDDRADSLETFTHNYPDLSAKLHLINLNYPAIGDGAEMTLRVSGHAGYHAPWGVMAFGVGATSLEYWGHAIAQGSASLQVPGLKALYDAGWRQILVVTICSNVSDTYLGNTTADLEIRIVEEEAGAAYNSFDFGLHVVGHWRHVIGAHSNEYEDVFDLEPWGQLDVIAGEMTGPHEFRGSFASQGATGEVIATLNAARDTLLSVSVAMDSFNSSSGMTHSTSFVATHVPRSYDDEDWTHFLVRGPSACDYLDEIQYEHHVPSQQETRTLTGFHCTSGGTYPSVLSLMFHKRPR